MHLSLFWKIMAAFVVVLAVGVGGVTLIAERTTTSEFQHYMFGGGSGPEQFVAPLADYYAQTGSWDGVQDLVGSGGMMGGRGMGRGGLGGAGGRFIVADTQGNIVADSTGVPGGQVTQDQLARGVPITVKGKRVGTLLPTGGGFGQGGVMGQAEQNFIDRVNRAVIFAGLIAGVVALLLGFMVFRGITAPLDKLTTRCGCGGGWRPFAARRNPQRRRDRQARHSVQLDGGESTAKRAGAKRNDRRHRTRASHAVERHSGESRSRARRRVPRRC